MSPSASWIRCAASFASRSTTSCRSRSRLRRRSAISCSAWRRSVACCSSSAFACCATSSADRFEVGAEAGDHRALLLDLALKRLGVLPDLRLDVRHQLALLRLDPLQLLRQALLEPLDIALPVDEPLLDRRLRLHELRRRGARSRRARARDVAAAFLGDPALLVRELRDRVGARPRERVLELLARSANSRATTSSKALLPRSISRSRRRWWRFTFCSTARRRRGAAPARAAATTATMTAAVIASS